MLSPLSSPETSSRKGSILAVDRLLSGAGSGSLPGADEERTSA